MNEPDEVLYQAIASRDSRFDGRVFVGVLTTGIYCRPICPARRPHRKNVRFFACAAAAEKAGFRACLRCHPEAAPGTPAWRGSSATVSRAVRLISEGALDTEGVEELARRLGVSGRHLRRLFEEHLGCSPVALAHTRRLHFARRLIDQTRLPMTEIAYAAGFSSIRRFNGAMRASFGVAPSRFRRGRDATVIGGGGGLCLELPYRPPYDWHAMLAFLRPRAIPGVESVGRTDYRRTVRLDGNLGLLRATAAPGGRGLRLHLELDSPRGLLRIVERVRKMFDLDADPEPIGARLATDPELAALVRARPGLRLPGAWDGFELAVRALLGQQISVKAATTLTGRLVEAFGESVDSVARDGLTHLFPMPDRLADADLSAVGLPAERAGTIKRLARAVCDGALSFEMTAWRSDLQERLRRLRGIGPWTAQYITMRAAGEPDAFPAGDLALRRALAQGTTLPSVAELERRSEVWRPWRAYAAMHLWCSSRARSSRTPESNSTPANKRQERRAC